MSNLFWDYQILSFFLALFFALYLTGKNLFNNWGIERKKTRNLKLILGAFLILSMFLLIYGTLIEPRLIQVKTVKLNFNKTTTTESLRLVQISDLHAGDYKKTAYFEKVAKKIIELQPDIIVLTGDYILGHEYNARYLQGLQSATKIFPTYAVTGNHEYAMGYPEDYYNEKIIDRTATLKKVFHEINVTLLENSSRLIPLSFGQIYLAGLTEIWTQPETLEQTVLELSQKTSGDIAKILLSHNPEIIKTYGAKKFDLILSGHTHGGQIRLPLIGALSSLPTDLGRKYDQGLFKLSNNNFLYINHGLGEAGPRARLFCPPEITLFEIDL